MGLSSADFDKLGRSLDDLTKSNRDLVAELQKQKGPGGSGVGAPGAGGAGPGGTPTSVPSPAGPANPNAFWNLSGKAGTASEFPLSALQGVLSAGGLGGASSALGAAAAGPAGVAGFGLGLLNQQMQSQQRVTQSGYDAYANAPVNESEPAREFRRKQAEELAQLEADKPGLVDKAFNVDNSYERGLKQNANAQFDNRARSERFESVEKTVERRTENFFSAFERAGVNPGKDKIREVAEIFKRQADVAYQVHADIQSVASNLTATGLGRQGQQGKR